MTDLDAKNPSLTSDTSTGDGVSTSESPLALLHVISYLEWEREGRESFDVRRARLLNTIVQLLEQIQSSDKRESKPLKYVILGGQTVILEDIATVRNDLLTLLVISNAGGKLGLGPWYVLVDQALVSGESLVRNLLLGRADAARHGIKLMPAAYVPGIAGHVAQLPQILRGFGIDSAFLLHGATITDLPFRWSAPDGSSLLVMSLPAQPLKPVTAKQHMKAQQTVAPDGPFLWLHNLDTDDDFAAVLTALEKAVDVPVQQSLVADYIAELRRSLPDMLRPALKGEIRLTGTAPSVDLLSGTLSARIHLKQTNAALEHRLSAGIEPLLALALTHGQIAYADNLRALLDYCWRTLLKTQSRNVLGGCSNDTVHEEGEIRARAVSDTAAEITKHALQALPGTIVDLTSVVGTDKTHVVVWNPHNWAVEQVIEVDLRLPPGRYPSRVLSHDGHVQNFSWSQSQDDDTAVRGTLSFLATAPSVGYNTYTIELAEESPETHHQTTSVSGTVIGNVEGETLVIEAGELVWKRGDKRLGNLLQFLDGGDAGDTLHYRRPKPDMVVKANLVSDVQIETSALYSRLIIRHRMRIAPELNDKRGRDRGVRLLELLTTATFYENTPGIYFRTTFENPANDHRLRAHIQTGLNSAHVLADTAFGLVTRPIEVDSPTSQDGQSKAVSATFTQPMHRLCAVEDETQAMVLLVRGLPEFEAIAEDGQVTLALTLLRAVGWLRRDETMGAMVKASGAQGLREYTAEYALVPMQAKQPVEWLRAGQVYNAPLQAYHYADAPEKASHSYLTVEGDPAVMTALKPPQKGEGWIVRFLNPTDSPAEIKVKAHEKPSEALLVNLAEEAQAEFEIEEGAFTVKLKPQQIVTVLLKFD